MSRLTRSSIVCAFCMLLLAMADAGEKPAKAETAPAKSEVDASKQKLLASLKESGLEVDLEEREVRMKAKICLSQGILEYLVCLENTFEYESMFSTKCKPSTLHLALLLIGRVPCPLRGVDALWWGGAREADRARVSLEIEYEERGEKQRHRVSELMASREQEEGAVPDNWVFIGSMFVKQEGKNLYAADHSGVVVSVWPNGSSVIQFAEKTGNPYQGDDLGIEVDAEAIPPVGTEVKLVFTPYNGKEKKKEKEKEAEK